MLRRILISSAVLSVVSIPALAQSNDAALQEEIRKVHAYNAQANTPKNTPATSSAYQDAKIKLLAEPTTDIAYVNTPPVSTPPVNTSTAPKSTASAPAIAAVPQPATTYTRIHRVVEDDTLYNLAKRNCITVADIQKHNAMSDNNIRIGQVLSLPTSKCVSIAPTPTIPAPIVPTQATIQTRTEAGVVRQVMPIQTGIKVRTSNAYAVLPKDSLYSIGKRYCVSAGELAGFNNIDTATPIQPGQILRLPQKACN